MNLKLINNIVGWLIFAIASFVFISTAEETASFWDCGEFIAVSHKLMVPHPPGAPFFLLIGRMFSLVLAGDNLEKVAYAVNVLSALSSAGAVLFTYWSIVLLAKRVLIGTAKIENLDATQAFTVIGSGVIGALSFTFADSFWFSAVEAEVYAMSTFFTAFVFWAMLKWDAVADEPGADKWILLIAYTMGLSIGVHLLSLLVIPAMGMIYYFRKYEYTTKGLIFTFLISAAILGVIQGGVIPGLPTLAGKFELLFVNSFGLPYSSGIIFFVLAFIAGIVWGIRYSYRKNNALLNTAILGLIFIIIGYASYGIIVIRANYGTPINENDPSDVLSFVSYLKREQYGDRPLVYGPQFNAQPIEQVKGNPVYVQKDGEYKIVTYKTENKYAPRDKALFPRMYSPQGSHLAAYKRWVKGIKDDKKPTFGQNMTFFFRYQVGWMFWRYFMWNFAGRAGDLQDSNYLLPWENDKNLPELLATNKARNQFFALPLILGLVGLYFHINRKGKDAAVLGALWFFTGIAIILYTNQPPIEPRERDYTIAGAVMTYCMWIGLGVLAITEYLKKYVSAGMARSVIAVVLCLAVPAVMAKEGWDDHDRSGRFHSVDSARNLLASCDKNAILFTGGDNDTFPLWYIQEVEGYRTDVRVCNLSLLGTTWYIDQMKKDVYDSKALPISLEYDNFAEGVNDYVPFYETGTPYPNGMPLKEYMALVKNQSQQIMVAAGNGMTVATMPTKTFEIDVDTSKVAKQGIVPAEFANRVVPKIRFNIGKSALYKSDLIMLDILANNNWDRPIYFSTTLSNSNFMNLKQFMVLEGLAYRLTPAFVQEASQGYVNVDLMYNKMMKEFRYRGLDDDTRFFEENYLRFPLNLRSSFYRLASDLYNRGDNKRALEVVDKCFKVIPDKAVPYDPYVPQFIPLLVRLGRDKQAAEIAGTMSRRAKEELEYYAKDANAHQNEINNNLYTIYALSQAYRQENKVKEAEQYEAILNQYSNLSNQQEGGGGEEE